jgi:hypothetical protein
MMQKSVGAQQGPGKLPADVLSSSIDSMYTANEDEELDPLYQSAKDTTVRSPAGGSSRRMYAVVDWPNFS